MTSPTLGKIHQPPATLREMVQERLREAIVDGVFSPGQRLVERPLCEQLGVSRTVIRETIRYLEAEGLVEILPGRGPIVATINWDEARQIYDIRRMLETAAAEACALRATPELVEKLSTEFSRMKVGAEESPAALARASARFYAEIFSGAGHTIAWEIVQRLNGRISRLRVLTLSTTERARPGIDHMTSIHNAICSGDHIAARHAVNEHLNEASAIAEQLLATEPLG